VGVAPEGVWPLKMKISITQLFLKPGTYFFVWKNIITPTIHRSMAVLGMSHRGGVAPRECGTRKGVAPEGVWPFIFKARNLIFCVEEHNNSTLS
jgi:hypothetical protein